MKDKLIFSQGPGKKKYTARVYRNGKLIKTTSFGHKDYQQYKDRTGLKLYSHLDHLDKDRRKNYLARSKGIVDKFGNKKYSNQLEEIS